MDRRKKANIPSPFFDPDYSKGVKGNPEDGSCARERGTTKKPAGKNAESIRDRENHKESDLRSGLATLSQPSQRAILETSKKKNKKGSPVWN